MVPLIMVAAVCAAVPGLIPSQMKQCQANSNAMTAVSEGYKRGLNECQLQFINERWNCTPDGMIYASELSDQSYRSSNQQVNSHHSQHHHPSHHHPPHPQHQYQSNYAYSNYVHNSLSSSYHHNNLKQHNSLRNYVTSSSTSAVSTGATSSSSSILQQQFINNTLNGNVNSINTNNINNKFTTTTTTNNNNVKVLKYPIFNQTIKLESRETAFIYAIISAGVVHAITEACSSGNLTECSCDRSRSLMPIDLNTVSPLSSSSSPPSPSPLSSSISNAMIPSGVTYSSVSPASAAVTDGYKWGGCSDNVRYGMAFAQKFIDAPDRRALNATGQLKYLVNLHNNRVGRFAVLNHMNFRCRCHGISGSCELRTCWRTLPSFNTVGKYLKEKYESAVQVTDKAHSRKKNRRVHSPPAPASPSTASTTTRRKNKARKASLGVNREELAYIKKSPNYCIEDKANGILGTSGRICSKNSDASDSCQLLCCGRGYNTKIKKETTRCQCKFEWCCQVQCKICDTETEEYTCK